MSGHTPEPPAAPPPPAAPGGGEAELRRELAELRSSFEELRTARTEPERRQARQQVQESEADLEKLARSAGISRDALERAMSEARNAERKEELRPIVAELFSELQNTPPSPDPAAGGDDEDDDPAKPAPRRTPAPRRQPPPKPDDEPAVTPHFSDRRVGEMFRR